MIKATNEELRKIYNEIPNAYDRANRFISFGRDIRWRLDLVKAILTYHEKPKRVIDIASGKGELSYVFERVCNPPFYLVMLDYAENMLKESFVNHEKVLASFDHLPLRENAADVLMSSFALHAADDIELVIREMNRVSKHVIAFIAMGKPDNALKRIYLSFYLKCIMPYIAMLAGAKPKDYRYIYYIYKKLDRKNSEYRKLFESIINVRVYEEKALNLFYFVVGFKKNYKL